MAGVHVGPSGEGEQVWEILVLVFLVVGGGGAGLAQR